MNKKNYTTFRVQRWQQLFQKYSRRLAKALQNGSLSEWSMTKRTQFYEKLQKLAARLDMPLKPALLAGLISSGVHLKKAEASPALEEAFHPDAAFRQLTRAYVERAYLNYDRASIDPLSNLNFPINRTWEVPLYRVNPPNILPEVASPVAESTATTIMRPIKMDNSSDFGANYGIYGGSLDYRLSDPNDPPAAPSQPDLAAESDTGNDGDNVTENVMPLLTGRAPYNTSITLESNLDGVLAANILVNEQGIWQVRLEKPLSEGRHQIIAKASNDTGISPPSAPLFLFTGAGDAQGNGTSNVVTKDDGSATKNSVVGGGDKNKASGDYATVGGGRENQATTFDATVGGGNKNTANNTSATVGGGIQNQASGRFATVGGGAKNLASADNATVGGGAQNQAISNNATVGGGIRNTASGGNATVGGGAQNLASGVNATVGGGDGNRAIGSRATVGGGYQNYANARSSATVGGGYLNTASGNFATVPGGKGLGATSYGETAIGIYNDTTGISPNKTGVTATDRLFVIGNGTSSIAKSNALVMLKSGDTQLNGVLSLSNGTDTLKLPNTKGMNGQVLTSDGAGNATWMNAAGGGGGGTGAFATTGNVTSNSPGAIATDDFVFGSTQLANDAANTSDDARMFFDKSKAAFRAGTVTGDQWDDANVGKYSTVAGGKNNKASAISATVGGGDLNIASGHSATVPGGKGLGATSYGETAIGIYNDTTGISPNKTGVTATDRLFVIGNGTSSSAKSNALIMLKSGDTQLNGVLSLSNGTDTLKLPNTKGMNGQVLTSDGVGNATWMNAAGGGGGGTGAFATTGNVTSNSPGAIATDDFVFGSTQLANDAANTSDDARMFFDKSKAAFRAGTVTGDQWDDANVGKYSTVAGGKNNKATLTYATVGGGRENQASGNYATVGGGYQNQATAKRSTVGGGGNNQATTYFATVGGGFRNQASGNFAIVGGGEENQASGISATVGGGRSNYATATQATVGGGYKNRASGEGATVGGGRSNQATTYFATVGGGRSNQVTGFFATVGGGYKNQASAKYATVGGGLRNEASANSATVPGGISLGATSFGETAIGIYNDTTGISPNKTGVTATDRLFVIGNGTSFSAKSNALVMLKSGDTQLNGVLSLSNGTDTLKLPNTKGMNGQVLTSDGAGNATWMNAAGGGGAGAFATTSNVTSNSPGAIATDDFVFGSTQLANDAANTSDDARMFFDKSKAAFRAGTVTGDQWDDANVGKYSTVAGGRNNQATALDATVGGGRNNQATGYHATVGGGGFNQATASHATVGGGQENQATVNYATVGGGRNNQATAYNATVGGGLRNQATVNYATVGGGFQNKATANYATVGGGFNNQATANRATVGGGYNNQATANFATIPGGEFLGATSFGETAIGIYNDTTGISPNKTGVTATDRLFVIGNGTSFSARSNALVMLKSGDTQLNGVLSLSNGTDTLKLPNTKGMNGQVLTSDGAGNATWVDASTGTGNQTLTEILTASTDAGAKKITNLLAINSTHGAKLTESGIWMNASDRNKKTNIADLEYGLEEILALHPVTYDYKKDGSHSLGFIAQEVEKILPELVVGQEGDKSLAYNLMTSVIVKAMQEMDADHDKMEAEIDALQAENKALKQMQEKMAALETENKELKAMQAQMQRLESMMAQLVKDDTAKDAANSEKDK